VANDRTSAAANHDCLQEEEGGDGFEGEDLPKTLDGGV